jgi:hypothetical protein
MIADEGGTSAAQGTSGRTGKSLGELTVERGDPGSGGVDETVDLQDTSDDQAADDEPAEGEAAEGEAAEGEAEGEADS